jgi:hypothetical protein
LPSSSFLLHPSSFRGRYLSVALSRSFIRSVPEGRRNFGRWALPTTASCGARTFLCTVSRREHRSVSTAFRATTVQPTRELPHYRGVVANPQRQQGGGVARWHSDKMAGWFTLSPCLPMSPGEWAGWTPAARDHQRISAHPRAAPWRDRCPRAPGRTPGAVPRSSATADVP